MALSDADQTRLDQLIAARDALAKGELIAKVQTAGGRTVEYGRVDAVRLDRLIQDLQDLAAAPASTCPPRSRGRLRFRI